MSRLLTQLLQLAVNEFNLFRTSYPNRIIILLKRRGEKEELGNFYCSRIG